MATVTTTSSKIANWQGSGAERIIQNMGSEQLYIRFYESVILSLDDKIEIAPNGGFFVFTGELALAPIHAATATGSTSVNIVTSRPNTPSVREEYP